MLFSRRRRLGDALPRSSEVLGEYRLASRDLAGFRTVLQDVGTSIAGGHASLVFESSTLGTVFRHACILGCALDGGYCFSAH